MRKLLLITIFLTGLASINAQSTNYKLGVHLGEAKGDFSKVGYGMNIGVDATYVYQLSHPAYSIGFTTGYDVFTGKSVGNDKEISLPTISIVPVAASLEYEFKFPTIFLGTDLGYAFAFGAEGVKGGLYYQPKFGYKFNNNELYISYKGITGDSKISSASVGYAYTFGKK